MLRVDFWCFMLCGDVFSHWYCKFWISLGNFIPLFRTLTKLNCILWFFGAGKRDPIRSAMVEAMDMTPTSETCMWVPFRLQVTSELIAGTFLQDQNSWKTCIRNLKHIFNSRRCSPLTVQVSSDHLILQSPLKILKFTIWWLVSAGRFV